MKRLLSSVTVLTLALIALPQTIRLPKVTRFTLPNGIRVVLMEYHRAPALAVRAVFRGGTVLDPAGKTGATSLMASLLTQGTERSTATGIADQIDFLGGSLNAAASNDSVTVSLDVLAKDATAGLKVMTEVIRTAAFPAEEFDRQKQLRMAGLRSLIEDPDAIADRLVAEIAFEGHPYGRLMTQTNLEKLTREDVVSAYRAQIEPENMILTAVGDFKSADMLTKLRTAFGSWQKGTAGVARLKSTGRLKPRVIVVDKPDSTQTQVRLVGTGMAVGAKDRYAAEVASSILGGGFTSRLVDEVRVNKGLTYSIDSPFLRMMYGGSFTILTFTKADSSKAILDAIRGVLAATASRGFTPAELKRVKGYLVGSFAARAQTPESLAGQLATIELYDLPKDYLAQYLKRIGSVTVSEANRVAKTYFDPDRLSIVLVGPGAILRPLISNLKNVEMRPLESIGK